MSPFSERASYFALRVCPEADADVWWSAVRRRDDIPHAIAALLGGLFVYPTNALGELANTEIA